MLALARVAEAQAAIDLDAQAGTDPDHAERTARAITDETSKVLALARVARTMAAIDPGHADEIPAPISPEQRFQVPTVGAADPETKVRWPVTLPLLGENVTEGTVTRWLKKEGERVEMDEPILEVSTDKVDTELPSPASGILRDIAVDEDETVAVGSQLAVIESVPDRR